MNKENSDNEKNKNTSELDGHGQKATSVEFNRRLIDTIDLNKPLRKMNLDRRHVNRERRSLAYVDYTGPARRLIIDRRLKTKDRRCNDKI